jgi:hypothetical protein
LRPLPDLPTPANKFYYLLRASDDVAGFLRLESHPIGSVLSYYWWDRINADSVYSGLVRLVQSQQVRDGNYEPRLVQVTGVRGAMPVMVLWLRSSSGSPDLYYWPRDNTYRGATQLQGARVYNAADFMSAARALPSPPVHNEAWAVTIANACARAAWPEGRDQLVYERASAEIGLMVASEPPNAVEQMGWYVDIPESGRTRVSSPSGMVYFVPESSGACMLLPRM